jgi:HSP20 family protein
VVRAALPGIKQEDVKVSIHGHILTISGERRMNGDGDGNGTRYVVREYPNGQWRRSMTLPQEVESARVRATYENGVLELHLPKAAPDRGRVVPINGQTDPPG